MSDTPRTDKILFSVDVCDGEDVVNIEFARTFERELNEANAIIRQQQLLDEENFRLQDRIKQLEVVERLATAQMDYIQQLEEQLMDAKNKYATLVADVALYEDRGERIKRLEEVGDYLDECLLSVMGASHPAKQAWRKAKEAKP